MNHYQCDHCEKTVDSAPGANGPPECCGRQMRITEPLPVCQASGAEHSRYDSEDAPCDDGRSG